MPTNTTACSWYLKFNNDNQALVKSGAFLFGVKT